MSKLYKVLNKKDYACAIHDTFEMCDRREIWGEDNKYIEYLKNRY